MFYFAYEPIAEENESKLSSQGSIRTDRSNTDESFELNVEQYIDFCEEPAEVISRSGSGGGRNRGLTHDAGQLSQSCGTTSEQVIVPINPENAATVTDKEAVNETNASCSRESQPIATPVNSAFYESLRGHLGATENDETNLK